MRRARLRSLLVASAAAALTGLALSGASDGAANATPPADSSPPTISGSAAVGQTLSASTGSWSGDTPITFSFEWRRCDTAGASCSAIAGATNQTYALVSADVGSTLRVAVTGTNDAGSGSAVSAPTAVVSSGPPVDTTAPAVSGSLTVGGKLTVTTGSWTGAQPITFSYQWYRCDTNGGNCANIGGATSADYTVDAADSGHRLVVIVTAKNSAGSKDVTVTVGNVAGGAPVDTEAPKVSGSLSIGSTLTSSSGTWTGTQPISISYQWQRCDTNGGNCAPIGGATASSYKITTSDANHRLVVVVTAKNSVGSKQAVVTAGNVSVSGPVSTAAPKASGSLSIGSTITVSGGSWSGTQPISISYQWDRCDTNGGNCAPIGGATGASYRITTADAGHRLVAVVTARNSFGSQQAVATAGNVGGSLPGGAVPVATISLPNRLTVDRVSFSPNPLRSRNPFVARFHVSDTHGVSVSGALVYVLGLPYGWTYNSPEAITDGTGWATITIRPTSNLPVRGRNALVMFVRARKPGESLLAGVSTRRLVQLQIRG